MANGEMVSSVLLTLGPIAITETVVTTWAIILILSLGAWFAKHHLITSPGMWQTGIEGVIASIESAIANVAPDHVKQLTPFIATIWIFLTIANLCGLIPGVDSPTQDLGATSALAVLVFFAVHWFGIRDQGWRAYLAHYLKPNPILLPFHIISEFTRTIALAVRLFGNIMSLEMAAFLVLIVAGFLAPVPLLMLHIIEALVQAYIFGMLALVYIAGGLQSHPNSRNTNSLNTNSLNTKATEKA